ncbi:hypothetical protein NC651_029278 [Populus alba x Populus x berolinensis]|nr:hypothetical protein NC651_029278 [Populus alba x Populus x berolinensis]
MTSECRGRLEKEGRTIQTHYTITSNACPEPADAGGDTVLGQKISLPTNSIHNTKRKIPLMLSGK